MRHLSALLLLLSPLAAACSCGPTAGPVLRSPAGAEFRLWQDASIFTPVSQLIDDAAAGQRLWVEMYEFGRSDLALALRQARDRSADVRVIVDRTVAQSARTADRLAAAGVAVRAYPVDDHRHQIDH